MSLFSRKAKKEKEPWTPNFIQSAGKIDFVAAGLPQYIDCYARIIDDAFTREELTHILAAGEAPGWEIAKVNASADLAFVNTSYRNGERIIMDDEELSAAIFEKIRPHLADIEEIDDVQWSRSGTITNKKTMVKMNERLRFLRYHPGGFFRQHIDGCYIRPDGTQRTHFTVQLYLPSSADGSDASFESAEGGSTRFLNGRGQYADVEAKPGRVLVFQHDRLLHTGEEIISGVKCAVRCDILYEKKKAAELEGVKFEGEVEDASEED